MSGDRKIDMDALKQAKLLDILKRVVANPNNAPIVAAELVKDWTPALLFGPDGTIDVIVGSTLSELK